MEKAESCTALPEKTVKRWRRYAVVVCMLSQRLKSRQHLRERGLTCCHYHADMDARDRLEVHDRWAGGQVQLIVATIAFGMVCRRVCHVERHNPPGHQ